jgi:uncharacterized membrane protein
VGEVEMRRDEKSKTVYPRSFRGCLSYILRPGGPTSTMFVIFMSTVGVGILSLPKAFYFTGIVGSIILLIFTALVTAFILDALVVCASVTK